jgi:hypothetical protein
MVLEKCGHRNCCNFFALTKGQYERKLKKKAFCKKKCSSDENYLIFKDKHNKHITKPKKCSFIRCNNFFMPARSNIKYCSSKCCQSQGVEEYNERNKEAVKKRNREYRRKYIENLNPEELAELKEKKREYAARRAAAMSPEEKYKKNRERYERIDKVKAQKIARKNRRKKYKTDKNFKMKSLIRSRIYNVLKRQGTTKHAPTLELLGCTIEELRAHIEAQFEPWMTWDNWAHATWHIDHIKPCASFDLTDPEQQRECFHYTNLRPLEATENMRKHARLNHPANATLQRLAPASR